MFEIANFFKPILSENFWAIFKRCQKIMNSWMEKTWKGEVEIEEQENTTSKDEKFTSKYLEQNEKRLHVNANPGD